MPRFASKHRSDENSRNASSEIGTIGTGSTKPSIDYIGRFAPSPTGPLHFGSLLAAIASFLEARRHDGQWLVRVEDIDPPRAQAGASDEILAALEHFGFEWDGPICYQSASRIAHENAIETLLEAGKAYRCGCSRRDLAALPRGPLGTIYPGTCRSGCAASETALRVLTSDSAVTFEDGLQSQQTQHLESESGDFIVLRRDGLIAYQLAVVVDDHLQGITDVVRGIDLMDSTARQICLQQLLGYATPRYCHIPVAVNTRGQKLSKSHGAEGVAFDRPQDILITALTMLGQDPPGDLNSATLPAIWRWAHANWNIGVLKGQIEIPADTGALA